MGARRTYRRCSAVVLVVIRLDALIILVFAVKALQRAVHLVTAQHVAPHQILMLTFSVKAATELKERLEAKGYEIAGEAPTAKEIKEDGHLSFNNLKKFLSFIFYSVCLA
mgnify:CR=1 FL=1